MAEYRTVETVVEAFYISEENASEVAQWCKGKVVELPAIGLLPKVAVRFRSPQGMATALEGNYLIKGENGTFTAMREADFRVKHKPAGEITEAAIKHHLGLTVYLCECGHAIDLHTPHSGCGGVSGDECSCPSSPNGLALQALERIPHDKGSVVCACGHSIEVHTASSGCSSIKDEICFCKATPHYLSTNPHYLSTRSGAEANNDERVQAWHRLVGHPALATCFEEDRPLIDALFDRLTDLAEAEQSYVELLSEKATLNLVVESAARGLDYMLGLQKDVERVWGRLPDPDNDEQVSTYIREVVLCATDELHEVLGEVHWKPWKDSRGIKNTAKYREELADVLHFVLDLYLAAGLSGKDMIEDYMAKHDENLLRNTNQEYRSS